MIEWRRVIWCSFIKTEKIRYLGLVKHFFFTLHMPISTFQVPSLICILMKPKYKTTNDKNCANVLWNTWQLINFCIMLFKHLFFLKLKKIILQRMKCYAKCKSYVLPSDLKWKIYFPKKNLFFLSIKLADEQPD